MSSIKTTALLLLLLSTQITASNVTSNELWITPSLTGVKLCRDLCEKRGGCSKLCYDASTLKCAECGDGLSGVTIFPRHRMSNTCSKSQVRVLTRRGLHLCVEEGIRIESSPTTTLMPPTTTLMPPTTTLMPPTTTLMPPTTKKASRHVEGLIAEIYPATIGERMSTTNLSGKFGMSNNPSLVSSSLHMAGHRTSSDMGQVPLGGLLLEIMNPKRLYYFTLQISVRFDKPRSYVGTNYVFSIGVIDPDVGQATAQVELVRTKSISGLSVYVVDAEEIIVYRLLGMKSGEVFKKMKTGKAVFSFRMAFYLNTFEGKICVLKQFSSDVLTCGHGFPKARHMKVVLYLTEKLKRTKVRVDPVCNFWTESEMAKSLKRADGGSREYYAYPHPHSAGATCVSKAYTGPLTGTS